MLIGVIILFHTEMTLWHRTFLTQCARKTILCVRKVKEYNVTQLESCRLPGGYHVNTHATVTEWHI